MRGLKTGGRKSGTPNKATASLKEAAQVYTEGALLVLVNVMQDEAQPAAARISAATAILDRGHGRPTQAVEVDASMKHEQWLELINDADLDKRIDELSAKAGYIKAPVSE